MFRKLKELKRLNDNFVKKITDNISKEDYDKIPTTSVDDFDKGMYDLLVRKINETYKEHISD